MVNCDSFYCSLNMTVDYLYLEDCSEFQAGSALKMTVQNRKLDVTAVFRSVCRHAFPLHFFQLKTWRKAVNIG